MGGFLASLGWQGALGLINTLWPIVYATVHVAESANPAPGQGAKKFSQVLDTVNQVAVALPQVVTAVQQTGKGIQDSVHQGDVAALSTHVGNMINLAVGMANATGAFQKSGFVQGVTAAQAKAAIAPAPAAAAPASSPAPEVLAGGLGGEVNAPAAEQAPAPVIGRSWA